MSRSDWCVSDAQGVPVMLSWYCPGCDRYHGVPIPPSPNAWGFDGNWDAPTLTPSVLVNKDATGKQEPDRMEGWVQHRCHVFVRAGRIQFLRDCTHHLAGQTVDLPVNDPWQDEEV